MRCGFLSFLSCDAALISAVLFLFFSHQSGPFSLLCPFLDPHFHSPFAFLSLACWQALPVPFGSSSHTVFFPTPILHLTPEVSRTLSSYADSRNRKVSVKLEIFEIPIFPPEAYLFNFCAFNHSSCHTHRQHTIHLLLQIFQKISSPLINVCPSGGESFSRDAHRDGTA